MILVLPNTALLATASIAWIFAVAAAAATAAAVGIDEFNEGPIKAFGGVIARPTLYERFKMKTEYIN